MHILMAGCVPSSASASPIRIYVLSSENSNIAQAGPASHAGAEPLSYIRWGMAAAEKPALPEVKESRIVFHKAQGDFPVHRTGPARKHHCTGGMRRKMIKLSNWLRQKVGLPPIAHHHHGHHRHHGHHEGSKVDHMSDPLVPINNLPVDRNLRPHRPPYMPHHHAHQNTFGDRLQKALLSLGPWEGRVIAFVLGKQFETFAKE